MQYNGKIDMIYKKSNFRNNSEIIQYYKNLLTYIFNIENYIIIIINEFIY